MGVNASRVRFQVDAAASVVLRDIDDGPITTTKIEKAVSLNELRSAYWHNKEIPHGVIAVPIHVTALDMANEDETYKLDLLVDDVSTMDDSPVSVASLVVTEPGIYTMYVDSKMIPEIDKDAGGGDKFLAIKATLDGTTPSLTYGAWMARSVHP